MVLLVGGGIIAFGSNESGCLGLGDTLTRWSPTRCVDGAQVLLGHGAQV